MVIRKKGRNKYFLYSHVGRILGKFPSRKKALKRERQINYFKNSGGKKHGK